MPVYDLNYQTWSGQRRGPLFRWLAIPRFTLMEFFGNRTFIWLFTIAWLQFILRLVVIYLEVNTDFLKLIPFPLATIFPIDANFFKRMIDYQIPFCFIFAFFIGSGLISRDLTHNAIVLFASKPISRWEYLIGKFSIPFLLFMLITWFQSAMLFAIQTAITPANNPWRLYFWDRYAIILGSITAYSLVIAISLSLLIMAASSLTRNNRYASMTFVIYVIGTLVVGGVLGQMLNNKNFWAVSLFDAGLTLGYYLFRVDLSSLEISRWAAWTCVLVNWVFCAVILHWRLERATRQGK
jgi:ABC-2 type transport system permease protein